MFLKSSASAVKSTLGLGRGVRISTTEPRVPRAPRRSGLSGRVLRGIKWWLFNFAVEGVAAKSRVILFQLQLFGFELLIAGGAIARRGFSLFARLGAFDGDDFARHNYSFS